MNGRLRLLWRSLNLRHIHILNLSYRIYWLRIPLFHVNFGKHFFPVPVPAAVDIVIFSPHFINFIKVFFSHPVLRLLLDNIKRQVDLFFDLENPLDKFLASLDPLPALWALLLQPQFLNLPLSDTWLSH